MHDNSSTVYTATTIADVQTMLKNIPSIYLVAGGTEIARRQTARVLNFADNLLPLTQIPELTNITKTERYLEFGSCVSLQAILDLGKNNVPLVLYQAVETISNVGLRQLGTIGGNISAKGHRFTTFASLLALDARLEIKNSIDSKWVTMSRYFSNTGKEQVKEKEFISKIRVPTETWDIADFRRFGKIQQINENSACFVFLVKSEKNVISDLRLSYAGKFFFRNRELENFIIGKSLPITEKDSYTFLEKTDVLFDKNLFPISLERKCFFNQLEQSLLKLC